MGLKVKKTEAAGGKHKARWMTREEAKAGAKKNRRENDKKACKEE